MKKLQKIVLVFCFILLGCLTILPSCEKQTEGTSEPENKVEVCSSTYHNANNDATLYLENGVFTYVYLDEEGKTHSLRGTYAGTEKNIILTVLQEDSTPLLQTRNKYISLSNGTFSFIKDMNEDKKDEEKVPEVKTCTHENTQIADKVEPTCTLDGYTGNVICTDCQKILIYGTVLSATGHSFCDESDVIYSQANCTYNERRYYSCHVCHAVATSETDTYEAEGTKVTELHSYNSDSGIEAKKATCLTGRENYCACDYCGKVLYEISKTIAIADSFANHDFTEKNDSYLFKKADCGHNDYYYYTCSVCGIPSNDILLVYEKEGTATGVHDFSVSSDIVCADATCVSDRLEYLACTVCGLVDLTKTIAIPHTATGVHVFTDISDIVAVPASCSSDQYNYYQCAFCKTVSRERKARILATATDHTYKNHVCTDCGQIDIGNVLSQWNVSQNANGDSLTAYLFDNENKKDLVIRVNTDKSPNTGRMKNYAKASDVPWATYQSTILHIYFAGAVTEIGDFSFAGCTALVGLQYYTEDSANVINIPSSVTKIGNYAFTDCSSLPAVTFPSGLTAVGVGAFAHCTALSGTVDLSGASGLTSLQLNAFQGCSSLTRVQLLGTALTSLANGVLEGCSSLSAVTLPSAITQIGTYALSGSVLESVSLPSSLLYILPYAFYGSALTSLTCPASVKYIGENAFADCEDLETIDLTGATNLSCVGKNAFDGTAYATNHRTDGVLTIGENVLLSVDSNKQGTLNVNTAIIADGACDGCSSLSAVVLGNNVRYIGQDSFRYCLKLTDLTIGNNLLSIGSFAFYSCPLLIKVSLPEGLSELGDKAFADCTQLRSFSYGSGLQGIENDSNFLENVHLFEVYRPSDLSPDFSAKKINLTSSAEPSCVKRDGDFIYAYADGQGYLIGYLNPAETRLTLPSSITSFDSPLSTYEIFDYAFRSGAYYSQITDLTLPSAVTAIGKEAFAGCGALETINLSLSVKQIGENAFFGTAFYNDKSNWQNATLYLSFMDTEEETPVKKYFLLEVVPTKETTVTKLTVQNNTVVLADRALAQCKDLTSLTLPATVHNIGSELLVGNTVIGDIVLPFIGGSKEDADTQFLGYLFGGTDYTENEKVPASLKRVSVISASSVPSYAFYECNFIENISLENTVTAIGAYAFYRCRDTYFSVGGEINSVGEYAFYECQNLQKITFSSSLTAVSRYAFYQTGLYEVILPSGVRTVSEYAFAECYHLYTLSVGNAVASLGVGAFKNDINLVTVLLGRGLTTTEGTINTAQRTLTLGSVTFYYEDDATLYGPDMVGSINEGSSVFTVDDIDYYYNDGYLYADEGLSSQYILSASDLSYASISTENGTFTLGDKTYTFDRNKKIIYSDSAKTNQINGVYVDEANGVLLYLSSKIYYYTEPSGSQDGFIYTDSARQSRIQNAYIKNNCFKVSAESNGTIYYYLGSNIYYDTECKSLFNSPYASVDTSAKTISLPYIYTYYYGQGQIFKNNTHTTLVGDASFDASNHRFTLNGSAYLYFGDKCPVFDENGQMIQNAYITFNNDFKKVKTVYLPSSLEYYFDSTGTFYTSSNKQISLTDGLVDTVAKSFSCFGKTYYYDGNGQAYSDAEHLHAVSGITLSKTIQTVEHVLYYYGANGNIYYDSTKYRQVENASININSQLLTLNGNTYSFNSALSTANIYNYNTTNLIDNLSRVDKTAKTIYFPTEMTYYYTENGWVYRDATLQTQVEKTQINAEDISEEYVSNTYSVYSSRYYFGDDGKMRTDQNDTSSPTENVITLGSFLPVDTVYFYRLSGTTGTVYTDSNRTIEVAGAEIRTNTTPATLTLNGKQYYFTNGTKSALYTDKTQTDPVDGGFIYTQASTPYFTMPVLKNLYYTPSGKVYNDTHQAVEEARVVIDPINKQISIYNRFYYDGTAVYRLTNKKAPTEYTFNAGGKSFVYNGETYTFDNSGNVYLSAVLKKDMRVDTATSSIFVLFATYFYSENGVYTDKKLTERSLVADAFVQTNSGYIYLNETLSYFDKNGYVYWDAECKNVKDNIRLNLTKRTYTEYELFYYFDEATGEVYTSINRVTQVDNMSISFKSGYVHFDTTTLYFNQNRVYSSVLKNDTTRCDDWFINELTGTIYHEEIEYYYSNARIYIDRIHGTIDTVQKVVSLDGVSYSYGTVGDENGLYTDIPFGTFSNENNTFTVDGTEYFLVGNAIRKAVGRADFSTHIAVINDTEYIFTDANVDTTNFVMTVSGFDYYYNEDGTLFTNCGNIDRTQKTLTVTGDRTYTYNGSVVYRRVRMEEICENCFDGCKKLVEIRNLSNLGITKGSDKYGNISLYARRIVNTDTSELKFDDEQDKKFAFMYLDGKNYLLGYIGAESTANMPDLATAYELYSYAFAQNYILQKVVLPTGGKSVTSIPDYAFLQCSALQSVTLTTAVQSIGNYAFASSALTEVLIPSNVTRIGNHAFEACTSLTKVTFGTKVQTIGESAFQDCISLSLLTLPSSLTGIGAYAFSGCTGMTELFFPSLTAVGAKSIGAKAFAKCTSLSKITWNTYFGLTASHQLFYRSGDSQKGISVTFSGLGSVPDYFFHTDRAEDKPYVTSVMLTNGISTIGQYAFIRTDIGKIDLPSSVLSIGGHAFEGSALTRLTLPDALISLGESAFADCSHMQSLTFGTKLSTLPAKAFLGCSALTVLSLPNSIQVIGSSAFANCENIRVISFSDNLTSVASYAFDGCTHLTLLYITGTDDFDFTKINSSHNTSVFSATSVYCYFEETTLYMVGGQEKTNPLSVMKNDSPYAPASVSYASSLSTTATVTAVGKVTALYGGTALITATVTDTPTIDGLTYSLSCTVLFTVVVS